MATSAAHRRAIVGDALVASRPRERRRWQPATGDHKGRPYEALTLAGDCATKNLSYTRVHLAACEQGRRCGSLRFVASIHRMVRCGILIPWIETTGR